MDSTILQKGSCHHDIFETRKPFEKGYSSFRGEWTNFNQYKPNTQGSRYYYIYKTYSFDYKQTSGKTVVYEYDIPLGSYHILIGKESKANDIISVH